MFKINIKDEQFLPHIGCQINFNLSPGEVAFFSGANGLGKTTLMRRIHKDQHLNCVHIEQASLNSFYDRRLEKIKEIFLDTKKNLVNKDKFNHLWTAFGLKDKGQRCQSTLSGGEEQALKLCLGLSIESPLYILDEPSQHLDSYSKSILCDWIQEEQRQSKSIIIVEHDLDWPKCSRTIYELKLENKILVLGHSWNI